MPPGSRRAKICNNTLDSSCVVSYVVSGSCWPGMGGRGYQSIKMGGPGTVLGVCFDEAVITRDLEEIVWGKAEENGP